MILIAAALGGMGLICMLYRRTLLGVLIGLQLLLLGAVVLFVLGQGHMVGLFIALSSLIQVVAGFSLSARLFYLKKRTGMDEVTTLKH